MAGTGIVEAEATATPRRRRGRPAALDWSQVEAALGVEPDAVIARRVGVSPSAVSHQRSRRGIPAPPRQRPGRPPSADWSSVAPLLWLVPDAVLAERLGVAVSLVAHHRHQRRRPRYPWQSVYHRLGVDSDEAIARDLGATAKSVREVRYKVGIPRRRGPVHDPDLGLVPDRVIAERQGVSIAAVSAYRRRVGVRRTPQASPLQDRIVEHLRTAGSSRLLDMATALRTVEPSIHRALARLAERGLVEHVGAGPGSLWRLVGAP